MTNLFTLPNGIRCVHEPRPGGEQVIFNVTIHSGSANETLEENGLTFLTQEAVNGGSKTLSRHDINEIFENRAANLITVSGREETNFGVRCLKEDAEFLFPILADLVLNPAYDPEEVEWTKTQIQEWIKGKKQDSSFVAGQMYNETVFNGQPAGLSAMGTEEKVKSFTPDQLRAKHAELLSDTSDIVISIGGDIDLDTAKTLAEQNFGHMSSGPARPRPVVKFTEGDSRQFANNEHLNLVFGFEAPGQESPERSRYLLLRQLLSGGMSSPLFQEIREKRSLVYTVGASYTPREGTGHFSISAGTGEGNARTLIEETMNLFGHFAREGFTQEQIEQAKDSIMRGFRAQREKLANVLDSQVTQIFIRGKLVSDAETEARLNDITSDDLRHACADLMRSGRYALAGVGPQEAMPAPDEIKAMMTRQLEGLNLPPKRPARDPLTAEFQNVAENKVVARAKPQITVLDNGLKVISVERPGMMSAGIWVGVGAGHETKELNGATHMMEHMMFKGTPSYPAGTIDVVVENDFAADLNANTSHTRTAYFFYNLLPEHLEKSVSMLGEMVFDANIGKTEYEGGQVVSTEGKIETVKGERAVVLEEIKRALDNMGRRHGYLQMGTCYPDQPLGRPVLGTRESLLAISADDLRAFRDIYYVPNNTVFIVCGPVKHEDVVASVQAKLGDKKPGVFPPPQNPVFHGAVGAEEFKNAQLSTMELVFEGVGSNHKDAGAYDMLATILSSGHSSRLYREIVDNKRLATGINAYSSTMPHAGEFAVTTQCEAGNIRAILKSSYETLARVAYGITPEELAKAKKMTKASLISRTESNHSTCTWYGDNAMAAGKMVTPEDEFALIDALSAEDIRRVALKLVNANPALASIVPPGTDPAAIPAHQELLAIRDNARFLLLGAPAVSQAAGQPAPAI